MKLYQVSEIAELTKLSFSAVYERIRKLNIKHVKIKDKNRVYNYDQVMQIKGNNIIKYYPIKTHDTYYIYQSKMNNQ